jgi:hypothetical protein
MIEASCSVSSNSVAICFFCSGFGSLFGFRVDSTGSSLTRLLLVLRVATVSFSWSLMDDRVLVGDRGRLVADCAAVSFLVAGFVLLVCGEATGTDDFLCAELRVPLVVGGTGTDGAEAAERAAVLVDLEPREEASLQSARRGEHMSPFVQRKRTR